ncbi:uncharacterized mitochondrial protein AtMg01250-like [Rutidosis leptorrhynchoides]|uniref:uncharacterized mitochondrial protein AtMg01250-like n=1 Tax=Rutidosis leptorrhynchoides TaxID=125765 RepID=UPI003A994032
MVRHGVNGLEVMHQMYYGETWCKWIKGCLMSGRSSVVINGSPSREFSLEKGLRQGDPLSPFLFLLVAEALSVAMNQALSTGFYKGVKVGNEGVVVSHLQFSDDALFFGEWSETNASNLVLILNCFGDASGLRK